MRGNYADQFLLILLGLLYMGATVLGSGFNLNNSQVRCKAEEREALLKFKQAQLAYSESNWLPSSWGESEEDCCKWAAIECCEQTDNVVKLDLSQNAAGLAEVHNLDWLSNLSSLRHLDLSGVNLSHAVNWPGQVNMLSNSLLHLNLRSCELSMPKNISFAIPCANFTSPLSTIDLSSNNLESFVFPWLSKYTNLLVLNLSFNSLEGVIPELIQFPLLRELYLYNNRLNGSLTESVGKLSNLQVLDVTSNYLEGAITEAHLSNLSMLQQLGFSFNSLSLKLSTSWVPPFSLRTIQLSSCKVGPAFPRWLQTQREFEWLEMSSAEILDTIPDWFWDLSHSINFLNLSHNQIQGTIPRQWFSLNFTGYPILDMSHNRFNGLLPSLHAKTTILNLSNNSFQGSITSFCETLSVSENLNYLDLSHNSLFGEIPKYCFSNMQYLQLLNLANNHFNGTIPDSVGQSGCSRTMRMLQLQNNLFTGELPERLMNCRSLAMLDLGENKLSGKIPEWIGKSLQNLVALRLSSNSFNGSIPVNLCQLSRLQILDLSDNNITGTLPRCLTNFTCMTKRESSSLFLDSFLRVVPPMSKLSYGSEGVSYGSVVGDCIRSNYRSYLDKLAVRPRQQIIRNLFLDNYIANLFVIFKGKNREFDKTLHLLKLIDLSSNKLEGEIPREITSLSGLIGLNLSRNLLSGTIPQSIDSLKDLDFLDLSRNHLSGPIPQSLATLSLLGYLNLANNNLSGKIPTGTQLQSFSASVYAGNRYLCGLPLPTKCLRDEATQGPPNSGKHEDVSVQEHANSYDQLWLYSSIALGFIVGFWGVCGSLVLKSSWRRAYFQSLENIGDRIYVTVVVSVAKLLRNFKIK